MAAIAPTAAAQLGEPPPQRFALPLSQGGIHLVPIEQFELEFPDTCQTFHLHGAFGPSVTAFDGTVIADPNPNGCGFETLVVASASMIAVYDSPLQDTDGDGLPDEVDANDTNPDAGA